MNAFLIREDRANLPPGKAISHTQAVIIKNVRIAATFNLQLVTCNFQLITCNLISPVDVVTSH